MESAFLISILVSSFAVYSSHLSITDWPNFVVAREGRPITLACIDTTVKGAVTINWKAKASDADKWKLVLSASERKEFSGEAAKASMQLTDLNFQFTGVFSLSFLPKMEDYGFYSCLIAQQDREVKERIILLVILRVTVVPAAPIPQCSTVRLIATVKPDFGKISWAAPGGISMKSEKKVNFGTVAKLPLIESTDNGTYDCNVHPWANRSKITFDVDVIVDADKVVSFTKTVHDPKISTATQAHMPFLLTCPEVQGDYVSVYWKPADVRSRIRRVYQYDRWRASSVLTEQGKKLRLAGPPYNAETGSFSFFFTPGLKDSGLYACDVYQNDNTFSRRTQLSVMKVKTRQLSSELELQCLYSETSQVRSAKWKYQDNSRQLNMTSNNIGSITTTLPVPITSDTAGNYTCTLELTNGKTVLATQRVILPPEGSVIPNAPSRSLSALLLLVPLVAAAVGVLLWRQKHISDHGIEQSLSVHSCEAENIYENPEDIRQAPPQGSVYMDLKPRGDDDVYKELERY